MGYSEFKSKFLNDSVKRGFPENKISLLKSALDKSFEKELPVRDNNNSFQIRDFTNSDTLKISYHSNNLLCKYSVEKNYLLVGTLGPAWKHGWSNISKDTYVSDQIDGFFHFANQYIHRGLQINLIGAIALTYGKPCDFRGNEFRELTLPYHNIAYQEFCNGIPLTNSKRNRLLNKYLGIINAFDPFVNKTIYYYVRALSLLTHGYDEEAITAADNAIDVIFQAIKRRKNLPTMDRKNMYQPVNNELHLPNGVIEQLEDLYQLRCGFSAHPAQAKWWDFYEIYEKNINDIMNAVQLSIAKFMIYEKNNRIVNNNPNNWSEWFSEYCDIVYDTVWFHKLPMLNN